MAGALKIDLKRYNDIFALNSVVLNNNEQTVRASSAYEKETDSTPTLARISSPSCHESDSNDCFQRSDSFKQITYWQSIWRSKIFKRRNVRAVMTMPSLLLFQGAKCLQCKYLKPKVMIPWTTGPLKRSSNAKREFCFWGLRDPSFIRLHNPERFLLELSKEGVSIMSHPAKFFTGKGTDCDPNIFPHNNAKTAIAWNTVAILRWIWALFFRSSDFYGG